MDALETLLDGVDHAALNRAAQDISLRYRARSGNLAIQNDTEALAYTLSRMPATQAAVDHVLAQLSGDAPKSILDFGAGPGTATAAARALWPEAKSVLIETNPSMRSIAKKLMPDAVFASAPAPADLVIAAYVLNEMADPVSTVLQLWAATTDRLILVDTGTPKISAMMRDIRDHLIKAGACIHAPCPHALICPFASDTAEGWCHFSVRLARTRLHKHLKGAALGYEDEKFTYLVAGRAPRENQGSRIIGYPRIGKLIGLNLCGPDGNLSNAQIAKSDTRYKTAKKSRWGDVF